MLYKFKRFFDLDSILLIIYTFRSTFYDYIFVLLLSIVLVIFSNFETKKTKISYITIFKYIFVFLLVQLNNFMHKVLFISALNLIYIVIIIGLGSIFILIIAETQYRRVLKRVVLFISTAFLWSFFVAVITKYISFVTVASGGEFYRNMERIFWLDSSGSILAKLPMTLFVYLVFIRFKYDLFDKGKIINKRFVNLTILLSYILFVCFGLFFSKYINLWYFMLLSVFSWLIYIINKKNELIQNKLEIFTHIIMVGLVFGLEVFYLVDLFHNYFYFLSHQILALFFTFFVVNSIYELYMRKLQVKSFIVGIFFVSIIFPLVYILDGVYIKNKLYISAEMCNFTITDNRIIIPVGYLGDSLVYATRMAECPYDSWDIVNTAYYFVHNYPLPWVRTVLDDTTFEALKSEDCICIPM